MLVLTVTWKVKPGRHAEAAWVFRKLQRASRAEPGCLAYNFFQHKDDPDLIFIYEEYVNEAALEAHRYSDHFLDLARKQLPTMADRLEANLYVPME